MMNVKMFEVGGSEPVSGLVFRHDYPVVTLQTALEGVYSLTLGGDDDRKKPRLWVVGFYEEGGWALELSRVGSFDEIEALIFSKEPRAALINPMYEGQYPDEELTPDKWPEVVGGWGWRINPDANGQ